MTDNPTERVKDEIDRAKDTLEEVKTDVAAAIEAKRGGAATSVDDALNKTSRLRADIEQDVATLRARIPDPDELRERGLKAGIAVGGSALAVTALAMMVRKRAARRSRERETREQASALARALARELAALDASTDAEAQDANGGRRRWLLVLVGVAGAAALWWRARGVPALDEPYGDAHVEGVEGPHGIGVI